MKEAVKKKVAGKVFTFPAFTPAHEGKKVFYLFSVRQVVEVLRDVKILPVPFSSIGAEGVTEWRGRVVPVLSLEKFLGIKRSGDQKAMRTIAIRSVSKRNTDRHKELYAIITVGAKVEQLDLPLECDAVETPRRDNRCVLFDWSVQDVGSVAIGG